MLAFVHIEKTAGRTFRSVLRRNFGACYCDVRPLFPSRHKQFDSASQKIYDQIVLGEGHQSQFGPGDLRVYKRLAPWVRCIAGHSVRSCLGLESVSPDLRYVAIFREPISRYLSHYTYGTRSSASTPFTFSFEEYLEKQNFNNFQTKKIAGTENLEAAKAILNSTFLLVGDIKNFDEFLVLLRQKLAGERFNIFYKSINVRCPENNDVFASFAERIRLNNSVDIELYEYVVNTILPKQRAEYGPGLQEALALFKKENASKLPAESLRSVIQKIAARLYYDPAAGIIRKAHGLPWAGEY